MSRQFSFLLLLVLSLSLLVLSVSAGVGKNKNAMLLQDVSTLIFTKGGPCQYAPQSAMCKNIGWDGSDVTWQCEAELPKGVKFGKVEVSCEGFSSRDDDHVLKGSCGLEYHLVGEARFDSEVKEEDSWWNRNVRHSAGKHSAGAGSHRSAAGQSWWGWLTGAQAAAAERYHDAKDYANHQYDKASDYVQHGAHGGHHQHQQQSMGLFGLLSYLVSSIFSMGVKLIAAAIVFFVLWRLMRPAASTAPQPAARRPAGMLGSVLGMLPGLGSGLFGGLSGNNNPPSYQSSHNAPPPPYEPSGYTKYSSTAPPQQQQQQAQQSGSGYSALHGLLGGSLVGYLLGRARGGGQQQPAATYTHQPSTVHHVHHNAQPAVNPAYVRNQQRYPTATTRADGSATRADGSSIEDVSDVRTTETSTAYATTKRR